MNTGSRFLRGTLTKLTGRLSETPRLSRRGFSFHVLPLFMSLCSLERSMFENSTIGKNTHDCMRYKNSSIGSIRSLHQKNSISGVSPRMMAELEERISVAIETEVLDPELDISLKDLGWVHRRFAVSDNDTIQILLKLPTLLHPSLDKLKSDVRDAALFEIQKWKSEKKTLEDTTINVNVEAIAQTPIPPEDPQEVESRLGPGLVNVANYVAVYSCKGGVGKSTVAVNLAYELAKLGGRVGLLDLDVYGPSLPILVKPDDPAIRPSPLGKGMVYPIEHEGVKLLSLGFVSSQSGVPGSGPDGGAAVLRGPMAGKVVTQLLKGTDWGDLDVLILDLPPGTGDVQLTLCQDLELSGAVGVTTPSKLAIADARKGIQMFSELGVPTMAMVENMAYFDCDGGTRHFPFGKGFQAFSEKMTDFNKVNICQLPISHVANDAAEDGIPVSLSRPSSANDELKAMSNLAQMVSRELLKQPYKPESSIGTITFDDNDQTFELSSVKMSLEGKDFIFRAFSEEGAIQRRFQASKLRSRDPKTGALLDQESDEDSDLPSDSKKAGMVEIFKAGATKSNDKNIPNGIEKKGKLGYEVDWADGAKYIYSKRAISKAAGGHVGR